jgi:hypothetical protein
VKFDHVVSFEVALALAPGEAVDFVRDVGRSLAHARFLRDLRVVEGPTTVVEATLPINAALFGQRDLPFRSVLSETESGARLEGIEVATTGPGWARVSGDAVVRPDGAASVVRYDFLITVYVALPEADRWGARALTRMIEFTASTVLERVTAAFPEAVAQAAREAEGADRPLAAATIP